MPRYLDTANPFNANAPGTEGLAAWLVGLPPRDGGNTLYDETGLTVGGSLVGGAAWSPNDNGFASIRCNSAVGDRISIPGSWGGNANQSIFFDFRPLFDITDGTYRGFIDSGAETLFTKFYGNYFFLGPSTANCVVPISTATSVMSSYVRCRMGIVLNAGTTYAYINGQLMGSSSAGTTTYSGSGNTFGAQYYNSQSEFSNIVRYPGIAASSAFVQQDYIRSLAPIDQHPWLNYRSSRIFTTGSTPATTFYPCDFIPGLFAGSF